MSKKYTNIKERVLYLAENQEQSKQDFFRKVGLKYSNFTGKSKESDLNSKAVAEILLKYPKISPIWLLTGNGDIFNEEVIQTNKSIINKEVNSEQESIEDIIVSRVVEKLEPFLIKIQDLEFFMRAMKLDMKIKNELDSLKEKGDVEKKVNSSKENPLSL